MAAKIRLSSPEEYTVGWIVALDMELAAAKGVLEEIHQKPQGFKKHLKDKNNYVWGRIGEHNVVITSLSSGRSGAVSASSTASGINSSLPHIRFGLMVGIGAGLPRLDEKIDIRLGDIVVSHPEGKSPGVVQYDLVKLKTGKIERIGYLDGPPEVLLKGVAALRANHLMEDSRIPEILEEMFKRYPKMKQAREDGTPSFAYQGAKHDQLYEPPVHYKDSLTVGDSAHTQGQNLSDSGSSQVPKQDDIDQGYESDSIHETAGSVEVPAANRDQSDPISSFPRQLKRPERSERPRIHYGIIASGNSVVKGFIPQQQILQRLEEKCICFEMEAAGLMTCFPCLVIRGICDYADEHKNDQWQNYAAATAAAYARELLEAMDSDDIATASPIEQAMNSLQHQIMEMDQTQKQTRDLAQSIHTDNHDQRVRNWLNPPDPTTNYANALAQRQPGSGQWFLGSTAYLAWKTQQNSFLWLNGILGCGKTILSSAVIKELSENAENLAKAAGPSTTYMENAESLSEGSDSSNDIKDNEDFFVRPEGLSKDHNRFLNKPQSDTGQWIKQRIGNTAFRSQADSSQWYLNSLEFKRWRLPRWKEDTSGVRETCKGDGPLWITGIPGHVETPPLLIKGCDARIVKLIEEAQISVKAGSSPSANDTMIQNHDCVTDVEEDKVFQRRVQEQGNLHNLMEMTPKASEAHQQAQIYPRARNLLYFFFDFSDKRKQSFENVVRSLLIQLYRKGGDLRQPLDTLYEEKTDQPDLKSLCTTFQKMVQLAGEIWIIIDALDESQERNRLISWMEPLVASRETNVHLLVTSRPEHDIRSAIETWARPRDIISIKDDMIVDDIRSFVHTRVREDDSLSRWQSRRDIQDEIETILVHRSNGMFRWVSCQLDALKDCLDYPTLKKALASLPTTLDETYERILAKIPPAYEHHARRLLQLLLFSERPLEIDEVVDALAVELKSQPHFQPRNRMPIPEEVAKCCSGLVFVATVSSLQTKIVTKEIRLAHFSVGEYLLSDRLNGDLQEMFKESVARSSIAKVCLAYMDSLNQPLFPREVVVLFPFAHYCAQYWLLHAMSGEYDEALRGMVVKILLQPNWAFETCIRLHQLWAWDDDIFQQSKLCIPLLKVIDLGWSRIVKDLLENDADPNAEDDSSTALGSALMGQHEDIVQQLLEYGANSFKPERSYSSRDKSLSYMIKLCRLDPFLLPEEELGLVEEESDSAEEESDSAEEESDSAEKESDSAEERSELAEEESELAGEEFELAEEETLVIEWDYHPSLQIASARGHETIVRVLLESGVSPDIEEKVPDTDTPLIAASLNGHDRIVQLLLDNGADANAQNEAGDSALQVASLAGEKHIVQMLLQRGANIHAQDGSYGTPLRAALQNEHEEVIRVLLDAGADMSAIEESFSTPLQFAQEYCSKKIVQILLDKMAAETDSGLSDETSDEISSGIRQKLQSLTTLAILLALAIWGGMCCSSQSKISDTNPFFVLQKFHQRLMDWWEAESANRPELQG